MKKKSFLLFRAFRYYNYRLFFVGQGVSLIGTWMQRIAIGWLVYRITKSPAMLGIAGFCSQFPTFVLAPFAGVLADKWSRHRIMIISQVVAMLQAILLAFLVLTNNVNIWCVIILTAILAMVNGFDIPARQSFVVEMVEDKNDLGNAIALNSAMFNGARLIGPSIAGVLIAVVGEGLCFLFNGLSYLAIIAALLAMRLKPRERPRSEKSVFGELRQGLFYAFGSMRIRSILMLLALVSLVGMPYTVLMPMIAREILHGGPRTLGVLMAAVGIGALTGAVFLGLKRDAKGLEKVITAAACMFGVGLIVFSFSRAVILSVIILVITGFGMMVSMASSNTVLQTIVDDDKRGRVMSFFAMAFMGMAPLGSLLGGWLAGIIGPQNAIMSGGFICIIGSFIYSRELRLFDGLVRSVSRRLGI